MDDTITSTDPAGTPDPGAAGPNRLVNRPGSDGGSTLEWRI
jgi:hypothetical protein